MVVFTEPAFPQELLSADRSIPEVIDHYLNATLDKHGVAPASTTTDTNTARRIYLDLVGRIPTLVEVQQFIADTSPEKKQYLIDHLIASPGFIRHQANEFDTLLMGGKTSIRDYLLTAFREKRPWDDMFRELIIGESSDTEQNGAIRFVKSRANDIDNLTNAASVVFFGVNISCAKCHDHPLIDTWTQEHFYGMKSFFSRTFDNGGFVGERNYGFVSFETTEGESRRAELMFLDGTNVPEPEAKEPSDEEKKLESEKLESLKENKQPPPLPDFSRRAQLVRIALENQDNNYFAKSIVNKTWNRFFGHGIVMPLDQMHPENEPSHPELLEWLARDLVSNNYDLTRLTRGILLSDAYARSSIWEDDERPDKSLFAVVEPRPLTPFQYAAALKIGSRNPDLFASNTPPKEHEKQMEEIEKSASGLASLFEQPTEDFHVSLTEALILSNSTQTEKELLYETSDSLVAKLQTVDDKNEMIELAVWSILSRPPSEKEYEVLIPYLAARENQPTQQCQQLVWILLTSSENRFNY